MFLHRIRLCALGALLPTALLALEPIQLSTSETAHSLGLSLDILEDATQNLTIDAVRADSSNSLWKTSSSIAPNFGFTPSSIWVHFRVINSEQESQERILDIAWDLLDHFSVYGFANQKKILETNHGRALPFHQRPVDYREFALPLKFPPGPSDWYMRFESTGPLTLPMTLRTPGNMISKVDRSLFFYGAIFGILGMLSAYSLFLFFAVRDGAYLYYTLFILIFAITEFHNKGFAFQYLQPEWIWSTVRTSSLLRWLEVIAAALFYRSFTGIQIRSPSLDRVFQAIMLLAALGFVAGFFLEIRLGDSIGILFFSLSAVFTLIASAYLVFKKNRQATIYLIAYTAIILAGIATALRSLGVLPFNVLTNDTISIGAVFQAMILSLGLADRYRQAREETIEARLKLAHDRIEISRNLHDVLGSDLGEIVIHSETAEDDRTEASHQTVAFLARRSLSHLRDIVRLLKINAEDIEPLDLYINQYLDRLRLAKRFEVSAEIQSTQNLPDHLNLQTQRIFLEWMANVVRHARPKGIRVGLRVTTRRITLYVLDDGLPFSWKGERTGSGLANIAERARTLHARVGSRRWAGINRFFCRIPLQLSQV
ncbi:MAG: hypothetical protein K8S54_03830 [Spirochaetia bacterium]|nr:hypothetical protein [Spirochaetia bacterium]